MKSSADLSLKCALIRCMFCKFLVVLKKTQQAVW